MLILIVEGNTAAACADLQDAGIAPYAQGYATVLRSLAPQLDCEIAYPSEHHDGGLPQGRSLTDYDGIAWTGSSLCISDGESEPVQAQLGLARRAYDSGVPVFGSCWGIQLMCRALGGEVRIGVQGREIGVSRHIQLTRAGLAHPMYHGKPHCFDALASHRDEVVRLPPGAELLAGNTHSPIQAVALEQDGKSFWGVQYHPEFDLETIAVLITRRGAELLREGFFRDEPELQHYVDQLHGLYRDMNRRHALAWQLGITDDILDPACRHRELLNWLIERVGPRA